MSKPGFYDIVKTEDLRISIPETSHFSIGTSPYFAHQHGLAIDIYHDLSLENYEILSPVAGKIVKIKSLIAPKPKFEGGLDRDYLILISNLSNPNLVWKLMHTKPSVKVGENIKIGDLLGKTIRNGYFAYWSSPHLHLEVRSSEDAIRARGGKDFSLIFEPDINMEKKYNNLDYRKIPLEIVKIYPEFLLGRLPESFYYVINPIRGVKAKINERNCILDGGIPHYKIGTVISERNHNFTISGSVHLGIHNIGTIQEINKHLAFLKFNSVKFLLNNKEIRGISLYLAKFLPLLKVIPFKKNQFSFKLNSFQNLSII